MTENPSGAPSRAVQRFWHNYLSILEKSSVPARTRPWYRKHVEGYIRAARGRRLADHRPADIDDYLAAKGRLGHLQEWQFRQIVDALRLLFCELVAAPWAAGYDWLRWRAFARTLEADHATLARDTDNGAPAPASGNPVVMRFREYAGVDYAAFVTTLRVRRMATRTQSRPTNIGWRASARSTTGGCWRNWARSRWPAFSSTWRCNGVSLRPPSGWHSMRWCFCSARCWAASWRWTRASYTRRPGDVSRWC